MSNLTLTYFGRILQLSHLLSHFPSQPHFVDLGKEPLISGTLMGTGSVKQLPGMTFPLHAIVLKIKAMAHSHLSMERRPQQQPLLLLLLLVLPDPGVTLFHREIFLPTQTMNGTLQGSKEKLTLRYVNICTYTKQLVILGTTGSLIDIYYG